MTPTPGQVAYAAYLLMRFGHMAHDGDWTYARLFPEERAAWEAVAQAVLALRDAGVDGTGFAPPGTYRKEEPPHA